jgi:hypothetical protein
MSISKPWFHLILLTLLIVIIPVQASQIDVNTVSTQGVMFAEFRETCDDFDSSIWTYYWNPPVVVGDGTWLFEFPAGESRTVQAVLRDYTDYGTYTLRFKVSARRPIEGLNWYGMFIFGESLNEIDFPENQGGFNSQTMTICIWSYDASGNRIMNPNEVNGQWYWFFDSATDFEDGDWHTWKVVYTPDQIDFYTDDILDFTVTNHNNAYWDVNDLNFFPTVGDLQLMIGGGVSGAQPMTWQYFVDEITYSPLE